MLDKKWGEIKELKPHLGVRDLVGFALETVADDWHPERLRFVLEHIAQMQDRSVHSKTYGNFRWNWGDRQPRDLNAVEFAVQQLVLLQIEFAPQMQPEEQKRLQTILRFAVEGIKRHQVEVSYTNIYLMQTWNAIGLGESLGQANMVERGCRMFREWIRYTLSNGVHEYLSPTYYGVDLDSLGLLARFARRAEVRAAATEVLHYFWTDISANWFEPCRRLCGAPSRTYDPLTGHGYLDGHLRMAGWLGEAVKQPTHFEAMCRWPPPAALLQKAVLDRPRFVRQRWGAQPWEAERNYIGKSVSIASAGACYGNMDQPLVAHVAGGPRMPMLSLLMDERADPYGKQQVQGRDGHRKATHVVPFIASVQRQGEVLLIASRNRLHSPGRSTPAEANSLMTHLILPAELPIWKVQEEMAAAELTENQGVRLHEPIFLRFRDAAVGIRVVYSRNSSDQPASIMLVSDGQAHGARRLTCVHSESAESSQGTAAFWIRVAEGLSDTHFAAFRHQFAEAGVRVDQNGSRLGIVAAGADGKLAMQVDLAKDERLQQEPGDGCYLLEVNGQEMGRPLLERALTALNAGGHE